MRGSKGMEGFVGQDNELVLDVEVHWKPVEGCEEERCHLI